MNGKSLVNVRSSLKNKSRSHFLEELFWPVDSKSLQLRGATFETQLSHGVWGLSFKRPPTVCPKPVSSVLR